MKSYLFAALGIIIVAFFASWYFIGSDVRASLPMYDVMLADGDTFDLTAAYVKHTIDGAEYTMLAYNGSIPGPTIRVTQGATVTINFTNNTDMPTLLHSHGVRMANKYDGTHLVQHDVMPSETFAYTLTFPDAGVYWYHPHAQEVYQQGLGMYGAFVVEPSDEAYFPPVDGSEVILLSDVPIEGGEITLPKRGTSNTFMGHYGNVLLTNGTTNATFSAHAGDVVRLYVVNAANARPFNFSVESARMKIVGGDSGAYEHAFFTPSVILGPSERAIIDVFVEDAGAYRMIHTTPDTVYQLGVINVATAEESVQTKAAAFDTLTQSSVTTESIKPFLSLFDSVPDKEISLTLDMGMWGHNMHMMQGESEVHDGIEWEDTMAMMNAMSNVDMVKWQIVDTKTGKKNMDINWEFTLGKPVKIRIVNDPKSMHPMQHPIHFHGQQFLVVARDGVRQTNFVWKDTTLVRAGETVDIVLDPSNVGKWMAHCHISEHLESGMMIGFEVK